MKEMRRFSSFTDKELDVIEEAFCIQGVLLLVEEVEREKNFRIRESRKRGKEITRDESDC